MYFVPYIPRRCNGMFMQVEQRERIIAIDLSPPPSHEMKQTQSSRGLLMFWCEMRRPKVSFRLQKISRKLGKSVATAFFSLSSPSGGLVQAYSRLSSSSSLHHDEDVFLLAQPPRKGRTICQVKSFWQSWWTSQKILFRAITRRGVMLRQQRGKW
jgi:hypothetical protein